MSILFQIIICILVLQKPFYSRVFMSWCLWKKSFPIPHPLLKASSSLSLQHLNLWNIWKLEVRGQNSLNAFLIRSWHLPILQQCRFPSQFQVMFLVMEIIEIHWLCKKYEKVCWNARERTWLNLATQCASRDRPELKKKIKKKGPLKTFHFISKVNFSVYMFNAF